MGCSIKRSKIEIKSKISSLNNHIEPPNKNTKAHSEDASLILSNSIKTNKLIESMSHKTLNEFWSSMPLSLIRITLKLFIQEIKNSNNSPHETIDYIIMILKNLEEQFRSSKFKKINKRNKKFSKLVGNYTHGIQILKFLGFLDFNNYLKFNFDIGSERTKSVCKCFESLVKYIN